MCNKRRIKDLYDGYINEYGVKLIKLNHEFKYITVNKNGKDYEQKKWYSLLLCPHCNVQYSRSKTRDLIATKGCQECTLKQRGIPHLLNFQNEVGTTVITTFSSQNYNLDGSKNGWNFSFNCQNCGQEAETRQTNERIRNAKYCLICSGLFGRPTGIKLVKPPLTQQELQAIEDQIEHRFQIIKQTIQQNNLKNSEEILNYFLSNDIDYSLPTKD